MGTNKIHFSSFTAREIYKCSLEVCSKFDELSRINHQVYRFPFFMDYKDITVQRTV